MAGSAGFSVTISATDNASRSIDAINKRIAAMRAPADRLTKSFGKLAENTGITALSHGMRDVARSSLQAFENMGRMVAPLGAITGAASIAGLARLTGEFAQAGRALSNLSQRTGISTTKLQSLDGAANLVGVSTESMNSGIVSLRDNLHEIAAGRGSPQAIAAFSSLGVSIYDASGRVRSVTDMLPELQNKLSAIQDPTQRLVVATQLFGGAAGDLAPVLRLNAKEFANLENQAASLNMMTPKQIADAKELAEAQSKLGLAAEGLGKSIGAGLAPAFTPVLNSTSEWIKDNKDLIAQNVAGWGQDYAKVLGTVGGALDTVVKNTIGWNRALEIGVPLLVSRMIPPIARLENALARLALIRIPTWLGGLIGIGGGGVAALASTLLLSGDEADNPEANEARRKLVEQQTHDYLKSHPKTWFEPFMPEYADMDRPRGPMLDASRKAGFGDRAAYAPSPGSSMHGAPGSNPNDPRGIRNNNPLNLSYKPGQGAIGTDGRFGVYRTAEQGIAAAYRQLDRYQQRGNNTVSGMINTWAPPNENDTNSYSTGVAKQVGVDPNAPIDIHDSKTAEALIAAMYKRETGRQPDPAVIHRGVELAMNPRRSPTDISQPPAPVRVASAPPAGLAAGPRASLLQTASAAAPPANIQGGSGTSPAAAPPPENSRADLHVRFSNMPPGATVTSKTEGPAWSGPAQIERSMPVASLN